MTRDMKSSLDLAGLKSAARKFLRKINNVPVPHLLGVTDGKAVGTHVEHAFHVFLSDTYNYKPGSSASGIDFPELAVDLKVTSLRQPQSSCPFKSASQKVFGLGYNLLVFVYEKRDDVSQGGALLDFRHAVFVDSSKTADYQTTRGILEIRERKGSFEDIVGFLEDRMLPVDEVGRNALAERIMSEAPEIGYLTVSNALQWRLQYGRVISVSEQGGTQGVEKLLE